MNIESNPASFAFSYATASFNQNLADEWHFDLTIGWDQSVAVPDNPTDAAFLAQFTITDTDTSTPYTHDGVNTVVSYSYVGGFGYIVFSWMVAFPGTTAANLTLTYTKNGNSAMNLKNSSGDPADEFTNQTVSFGGEGGGEG